MAEKVGSLLIELSAGVAKLQTDMNQANRVVQGAVNSMSKSWSTFKAVVATTIASSFAKSIVDAGKKAEMSANLLTIAFKRQQAQVGLTRDELDQLAESMAAATQFDDNDFKAGEAELLKFGNIYGDVFTEAVRLSADLGAGSGNLAGAFDAMGKALANPTEGLKGLSALIGKVSAEERDHILTLAQEGKGMEAQVAILKLVRSHVEGTAEAMNTGWLKSINDSAKAWDKFKEAIAGIIALRGVTDVIDEMAAAIRGLTSALSGGSFSEGMLGKRTAMAKQITELQTQIQDAEKKQGLTFTDDEGRVIGEDLRLDDLKKKLQALQEEYKKLYEVQAAPKAKGAAPKFGQTPDQIAFNKSLREQLASVGGGPIDSLFARADELKLTSHKIGGPVSETTALIQKLGQAVHDEAQEEEHARQMRAGRDAAFAFNEGQREQIRNVELLSKNLHRASHDAELATESQRMDNDIRAISINLLEEQRAGFEAQAKTLKEKYLTAFQRMQEESIKWQTGFDQAFNIVTEYATDSATQVRELFLDAFRGMEDALVSFVKTGKLSFRDLADSIITDLIRIEIKQNVILPLSAALSGSQGAFAGLFGMMGMGNPNAGTATPLVSGQALDVAVYGGGHASGGPVRAGTTYMVGERGPELFTADAAGSITPNDKLGGNNVSVGNISIGAGASVQAVQALHRMIMDLRASVGPTAVQAVTNAYNRGAAR